MLTKQKTGAARLAAGIFFALSGLLGGHTAGAATPSSTATVTFHVVVLAGTCATLPGDTTLPLGEVSDLKFKGKGTVVAQKKFSVQLQDCDESVNAVAFSVEPTDADKDDPTAFPNAGSAGAGVGIKVASGDVALDPAGINTVSVEPSEDRIATLPLEVSMVQTSDIRPHGGDVQSVFTLNISYA
ncbi:MULTISPECIES: fimbrial protein [Tenebrionibacter/Tenebrionicola group]|uniref:Fimbrial-type adhesion domain-containing protein n=2 Tax=Tenebrionibacter/Tenebrionicola group TaxID=2969848 RepID=A0A8K0V191_9ENTR|nr:MULTISPECIES: fimbrial protein [Tenebrionibacter/Tenebrionicola group]MBK4715073.1 hypothetical protein [Tenebrionibacter intestinalis]MBV5096267.1 hypothetical protein [Tenebrionicola larvae]